jgi:subtilisin-like proprotein convertase family protein
MFVERHKPTLHADVRVGTKTVRYTLDRLAPLCALFLAILGLPQAAYAQTITQYTVADAAPGTAITDTSCPTAAAHVVKTFTVPASYIIGDLDLGIHLTHTFRSDLIITLKAPGAGPTVTVMTNAGGSGDNLNDLFDDEAAAAFSTHSTTAADTAIVAGGAFPFYALSAAFPYYQHSFQPGSPFTVFDGRNAAGTWTLDICDNVGADVGNFKRADLYITSTSVTVAKSSSIVSDPVSSANPKAIPGAVVRYCILVTGNGKVAAPNVTANPAVIAPSDTIPATQSYVAGSLLSGTSCATATTAEDDDNAGADESDPFGMAFTGSAVTGSAASLAPGATFAMVFRTTIN